MKKNAEIFLFFALTVVLFTGCSSSVIINTIPPGAKLYADDQYKGVTPFKYTDSKLLNATTELRFELLGYETLKVKLVKNEKADAGAIAAGYFLVVPLLWSTKYDSAHTFELKPLSAADTTKPASNTLTMEKTEVLRRLRKLYDDGTLTKEEFETEKKKILDGQ